MAEEELEGALGELGHHAEVTDVHLDAETEEELALKLADLNLKSTETKRLMQQETKSSAQASPLNRLL